MVQGCTVVSPENYMQRRKKNLPDLSRPEWERLIDDWIFSERDRALFRRWLFDDIGFDLLSEEFGLSPRYTKTIIYEARDRLISKIARIVHENSTFTSS